MNTLKLYLDHAIDTLQSRADYTGIQSLLGTVFGAVGAERNQSHGEAGGEVPGVTSGAERHQERGRPEQLRMKTAMVVAGGRDRRGGGR